MKLKRLFLTTSSFFILLWGCVGADTPRQSKIDRDIEQLEEMKRGFEAKALRHEDKATYLQFNPENYLEMRRHLELAEENKNKAAIIQKQIDQLKAKKQKLY